MDQQTNAAEDWRVERHRRQQSNAAETQTPPTVVVHPKPKPEKGTAGRHGYTDLSYSCKTGHHASCFAKHCKCEVCNHPEVN